MVRLAESARGAALRSTKAARHFKKLANILTALA
jgi:hypothetical protein